jgi:hypothetical protein
LRLFYDTVSNTEVHVPSYEVTVNVELGRDVAERVYGLFLHCSGGTKEKHGKPLWVTSF